MVNSIVRRDYTTPSKSDDTIRFSEVGTPSSRSNINRSLRSKTQNRKLRKEQILILENPWSKRKKSR